MAGNSSGSAPRVRSRSDRALACSRARVTTIFLPNRGCVAMSSNHCSFSRRRTTSPTTHTAGGVSLACFTSLTIVASVPTTTRCRVQVPHCTRATGVSAVRPFSCKRAAISGRASTPIRKISVSPALAMFFQSRRCSASPAARVPDSRLSSRSWPVTMANELAMSRCVTGMPAYAGAAIADVTPGTTSNGTPASRHSSASSPPRPNTNGSPPFRRATLLPCLARSISRALMSGCFMAWCALTLPT